MKNLSLKIPEELHAQLTLVSQQRGTAKSDVVREAIEAYFANPRNGGQTSCADLAGDLIGSVEGPTDLATNPKYLAGYGK